MNQPQHWLYRPELVPRLWTWGAAVLLVLVLAELFVSLYGHFGFADWFGFHALYGFASCVAMVFIARAFGRMVRRREDFYEPVVNERAARADARREDRP